MAYSLQLIILYTLFYVNTFVIVRDCFVGASRLLAMTGKRFAPPRNGDRPRPSSVRKPFRERFTSEKPVIGDGEPVRFVPYFHNEPFGRFSF